MNPILAQILFGLIVLGTSFSSLAQNTVGLDWSSYNNRSVCASSRSFSIVAYIQELKIKRIIQGQEVFLDVGQVSEFSANGQIIPVIRCQPLATSQVSNGTYVRCFARVGRNHYDIYIRRFVNASRGGQQQIVNVIPQGSQAVIALNSSNCP